MGDPTFSTRAELSAWARQRLRYPAPYPGARLRALEHIRRITKAHAHLPIDTPTPEREAGR